MLGNVNDGVAIVDASGNTVGGTTAALANIIANNQADGVAIQSVGGAAAANNLIAGNFIGTNTLDADLSQPRTRALTLLAGWTTPLAARRPGPAM